MTKRTLCAVALVLVAVSVSFAQTTGTETPTLLQDRGLQLGLQIGGLIGDNEQPKEMRIIRLDNVFVDLFETFSPRVFLDYGLMSHVRGQVGASFGKIVGRYYETSLVPIDYRFMIIPFYARCFSPYVYIGIGGLHYDVTVAASRMSPGVATSGWAGFMPYGVGFVSQLSDRLALDFNVGYNNIFSDDVNGRRGSEHDSYYSGHFGIRIPLGKTAVDRQEEALKSRLAAEEQQRKDAEMKAAEEQRRKNLEAQKAAEEKRLKDLEAQRVLEAQKAPEVQKPAEPVAPKVEQQKVEIKFEPVYFHTNKSKLGPEQRAILDAAAKVLRENPDMKVEVQGHTDITGSRAWNVRLAVKRANAAKAYLVSRGIAAKRMTVQGYASGRPVATNETPEGRHQNRRAVEIVVK